MIIASWNVNSLRARIELVKQFIEETGVDVLLLQETKCTNEQFPHDIFEDYGYNIAHHGQKSYNGVAILSKMPLEDVNTSFYQESGSEQARYIEATISLKNGKAIRLASVYVPNGGEVDSDKFIFKLDFLEYFYQYLAGNKEELFLVAGDFNVAPYDLDMYDASLGGTCCTEVERRAVRKFFNHGFIDLFRAMNPHQLEFTWWDYRHGAWPKNMGLRIDYFLASPMIMDYINKIEIAKKWRGTVKASDHAPILAYLDLD